MPFSVGTAASMATVLIVAVLVRLVVVKLTLEELAMVTLLLETEDDDGILV